MLHAVPMGLSRLWLNVTVNGVDDGTITVTISSVASDALVIYQPCLNDEHVDMIIDWIDRIKPGSLACFIRSSLMAIAVQHQQERVRQIREAQIRSWNIDFIRQLM